MEVWIDFFYKLILPEKKTIKNMLNLDEENIEFALGKDFGFLAGQESRECCVFYF